MVPWWNTHKPGSNHKEALYDLKIKECLQNYQDKLFKVVNGKKHKEEAETNSGEFEDLRQSVKCSSGRGGLELSDCEVEVGKLFLQKTR